MKFQEIPLHGGPAGENGGEERGQRHPERFLNSVDYAQVQVYFADKPTGAGVVICPGGGYGGVSLDKEGLDFARLLASWGITSLVLVYRNPRGFTDPPLPLQDVRGALALARDRAAEWKLDPGRLGVFGFSAGGHLALTAVREPGEGGVRPSFLVLGYPVVTMEGPSAHQGSVSNLLADAPPALRRRFSGHRDLRAPFCDTFVVHTDADTSVPVENSVLLHEAIAAAGGSCEFLRHPTGIHGFGLGPAHGYEDAPDWTPALHEWLRRRRLAD